MVVLQGDLGAGRGCELASADETAQREDQLLELGCGKLRKSEVQWQGTSRQSMGCLRWQERALNSRKASRAQA